MIDDSLPKTVLHSLVRDLPGPKGESEEQRALRFADQLAEVMTYNPRDSVEAMIAIQCVTLRLMAEDCYRDAGRVGVSSTVAKQCSRDGKQFEALLANMRATLHRREKQPVGRIDPTMAHSMGLGQFLIPDPDDPDQIGEAFSGTIVPLHSAPKMLQ